MAATLPSGVVLPLPIQVVELPPAPALHDLVLRGLVESAHVEPTVPLIARFPVLKASQKHQKLTFPMYLEVLWAMGSIVGS